MSTYCSANHNMMVLNMKYSNFETKLTAYKSLTTPAPEYVNVVWYPYIKVGSEKLDKFKIELQGLFAIYTTGMPARRNHTEQTYNLWEIGRE